MQGLAMMDTDLQIDKFCPLLHIKLFCGVTESVSDLTWQNGWFHPSCSSDWWLTSPLFRHLLHLTDPQLLLCVRKATVQTRSATDPPVCNDTCLQDVLFPLPQLLFPPVDVGELRLMLRLHALRFL